MQKRRKHHRRWLAVAGVAFVLMSGLLLWWTFARLKLNQYRSIILNRYADVLASIEVTSRALPNDFPISEPSELEAIAAKRQQVEMAEGLTAMIDRPGIAAAGWSLDGHHGNQSLIWRVAGYGWTRWCWSDEKYHLQTVYYGKANDGADLVVMDGIIPGGRKRCYQVVFFAKDLNAPPAR